MFEQNGGLTTAPDLVGYTALEPGGYLWSSPHGYQYLRDHRGTTDVSHNRPPDT